MCGGGGGGGGGVGPSGGGHIQTAHWTVELTDTSAAQYSET